MASLAKTFGMKPPAMPELPKPVRMPTEDDPDILAAAQRTREAAQSRKGRASTILSDNTSFGSGIKLGA